MIVPNIRKPKLHFKSKTAFYRAQLRFTSALAMCMDGQHMTDTEIEVLALLLAAPNPTGDPFSTYNRKQVRDKLGMNNQAMSNHLGMLYKKGYLARSKGAYFLAAFLNLDLDAENENGKRIITGAKKKKLAKHVGLNITQEQFENDLKICFQALEKTWELAY